ncbi:hypothetical protein HRR83_002076 [Exophiala dermatitidis]|uniref:DUF1770-domain-containing protein n=1 Tax=Exophiala dermatitidis TaxID=5970 RepID=A0AAN6IVX3_EXODE|nr:hypothetical protein HRR74_002153 [Exophiala dermatitidis]KAJ4525771.1 hypothetical protein HRR73_002503 [Exophiala dermatitidis]KAJ4537100.1 hypothetical protein HRR76_005116 [Exophiala dermatitidis]KAJ4555304.1 hypothetical protein HRR77_001240 [Exophiala dermatitidis]KAJ4556518.1 hypothetical protein HRR78_002179 [Exophiala dermatitidis]
MASNPVSELASTIQTASIKRHPSPSHDLNPSTAASKKIPATVVEPESSSLHTQDSPALSRSQSLDSATSTGSKSSTIPSEIIRPRRRRRSFPPIPDFRFEQSYLASIKNADTKWKVAFITIRDQVFLPLVQGILWNMLMFGWRHWNRGSKFKGRTLGARLRKWWWGVNNWKLPADDPADFKRDAKVLKKAEDFFVDRFGSSLGD